MLASQYRQSSTVIIHLNHPPHLDASMASLQMQLFQNKYRIPPARLQGWDYGLPGLYFVTICTKDRINYFGAIRNRIMCLNDLGQTVYEEWMKAPVIRPDMNIELDSFVVMPNHFHGILIIGDNEYNNRGDAMPGLSINKFGPQAKNLSSILRGFKSAITSYAVSTRQQFIWQERFHDHIIRSNKEFLIIQNYIENNIIKWADDKFYHS